MASKSQSSNNPLTGTRSFILEQGKTNILYLGIVLVVAVIVLVAIMEGLGGGEGSSVVAPQRRSTVETQVNTDNTANISKPAEEVVLTKPENPQELPFGFPDIPLYNKKELTESYELAYKTSNSDQKVINFTSSKPVKDTFKFYKDWAPKNGWAVVHHLDNENESRLIIQKGKEIMNITIMKSNKEPKGSMVNMTW